MKRGYKRRGRPPLKRRGQYQYTGLKRAYKKRKKYAPRKKKETRRPLSEAVIRSRDLTYRYKGNEPWLILELYDDLDLGALYGQIENDIISIFGENTDYFIPVYSERVREKSVCVALFDGYVFVKEHADTTDSLSRLKSEYIKGPLSGPNGFQMANNENINGFKKKLEKKIKGMVPEKGQRVIPRVGTFKNLEGRVLSVNKTKLVARVLFEKASRVVEAPISVVNLDVV